MLSLETQHRVQSMSSTALLVIDYTKQNTTHDVKKWGLTLNKVRALQSKIETLVIHSRDQGIPVIWIGTAEWVSKNLPDNINALYRSNPNAAFYKEGNDQFLIEPDANDAVFFKNTYSAFSGTNGQLERFLNQHGINHLNICGIYSTGCVNNTIIEGFALGYHFTMIKDCVETFDRTDKQTYQKLVIEDWGYMYGTVTTLNQFIKR